MAIVRCTLETRPKRSEEDWARFDAMADEDIDFSDIPEMNEFSGLVPRHPSPPKNALDAAAISIDFFV